ncbi:PREDICTED: uncharacterized protein LOC109116676 [Tarenaya hassleriana]|uniref:uncharacterized protein LOC109116676 n=1 Tax=Tarenaya hassleriana TaxID=28532 RepID=UPI0008FD599A|nr:PREDICTED: uncharacterized protein LOC109116676 [Tarenaya hassleriana]
MEPYPKGEQSKLLTGKASNPFFFRFSLSRRRQQQPKKGKRTIDKFMPSGNFIRGVAEVLHKALGNFKSICFRDYQKLRNRQLFFPFSCSGRCPEEPFSSIYDEEENEFQKSEQGDKKNALMEESSTVQETKYESPVPQKKKGPRLKKRKVLQISNEETERRDEALAQKMKDYNMMDMRDDTDHALDIREALRCYSRIRSPVYLDIVDNFFTDMYHEFADPHTSCSDNILINRAGSFSFRQ